MIKCILTVGIPASSKSTWAKAEVAKDPTNIVRINNDEIRAMTNGSVFSTDYEKLITETRNFLIKEAFRRDKSVIVDNVNSNKRHFETCCKLAKEVNRDIQVLEKPFYIEIEEAIARDAKREGSAKVGETVIRKFWKELGGKQFAFYHPRVEVFTKRNNSLDRVVEPMVQDESKEPCLICDLDGTLAKIGDRSPYSAENCDLTDSPNSHVVETVKLYFEAGCKVIFCSGRMEKDRAPTMRFIERCLPGMPHLLLMRNDSDLRKDAIVKEEIFNEHIKDKYWVKLVIDDRLSVCRLWFSLGLNLLRVGDPDANF